MKANFSVAIYSEPPLLLKGLWDYVLGKFLTTYLEDNANI